MTNDLLPCPFCGNDDPLDDGMPEASLGVCCGETGCPIDGVVFTRRDWNTRTPNKPAEVDLDALKRFPVWLSEADKVEWDSKCDRYNQGWNACIDHLASTGRIRPDNAELAKVRDNLEYLVDWQAKDGSVVVGEVAQEALSIIDRLMGVK